jgi:hypothetical protein
MTDYFTYNVENHKLFISAKETAFRTSAAGKDTYSAATTYYPLGIQLTRIPRIWLRRKKIVQEIAGYADWGHVSRQGYEIGMLQLTGEIKDFSQMLYYFGTCTTIDNSPDTGYYTHVFTTTTARPSTIPSFQLLYKLANETSAESIYSLLTGCIVTQVQLSATKTNAIQATISIEFANIVAATAPNAEPEPRAVENLHIDKITFTLTKATTAYNVLFQGFTITIKTGFYLYVAAGEDRASRALKVKRDFRITLNILAMEKIAMTDFEDLDPATASDLDLTMVHTRVTTYDVLTFAWEKLWSTTNEYDWGESDYHLQGTHEFMIKPTTFESGAKLTVTEVNELDDDRYET